MRQQVTKAEWEAAEKRMLQKIAERGYMPPTISAVQKPKAKTLDDVYTREERLRMAYAPVIVTEII